MYGTWEKSFRDTYPEAGFAREPLEVHLYVEGRGHVVDVPVLVVVEVEVDLLVVVVVFKVVDVVPLPPEQGRHCEYQALL